MVQIDQPKLGLPSREYFLKDRQEKAFIAYEQFAVNLAVSLGANRTQALQDIADIMQFEVELAQVKQVYFDSSRLYIGTLSSCGECLSLVLNNGSDS